jgi:hypothetical protein
MSGRHREKRRDYLDLEMSAKLDKWIGDSNMTSSSEAFEKFSLWSDSKTWLKVTVIERGRPEDVLSVRICGLDKDASLVGVVGKPMHSFAQFDVDEAEFSIEPDRIVVSREDVEWLIFEVDSES